MISCKFWWLGIRSPAPIKPILIEAGIEETKTVRSVKRIGIDFYLDVTQQRIRERLVPIPDSIICERFSNLLGVELHKHGDPMCPGLLLVDRSCVIRTVCTAQALSETLARRPPWNQTLLKLCYDLGVEVSDCGLTGSWALGSQGSSSDIDLVIRLRMEQCPRFSHAVPAILSACGGSFPDKYGLYWPLRIRTSGYDWCLFPTYVDCDESPLLGLKISEVGASVVMSGTIIDAVHGIFSPSVLTVWSDSSELWTVVFPNTEARGVFEVNDRIKVQGRECIVATQDISGPDRRFLRVVDGLHTCPSLASKLYIQS